MLKSYPYQEEILKQLREAKHPIVVAKPSNNSTFSNVLQMHSILFNSWPNAHNVEKPLKPNE